MTSFGDHRRSSPTDTRGRASSSNKEERESFKRSLDREYKLITSNHSPLRAAKERYARSSDKKDGLQRAAYLQSQYQRRTEEEETPHFDNSYFKQEIQNARSNLQGLQGKSQKTSFARSEIYTTKNDQAEIDGHDEKDIIKKIQNEREQELHDEMNYKNSIYPNVGRNPTDRKDRKKIHMAYEERERDVNTQIRANHEDKEVNEFRPLNRSFGNSRGFDKTDVDKGSSLRDWNTFKESILRKSPQAGDADESQQGYFTNKDLVRAKYEQYEQGLQRKIQKNKGKTVEFDDGQSAEKANPLRDALDKRQEDLREREEQRIRFEHQEAELQKRKEIDEEDQQQVQYDKLYKSDGFNRALENKERRLQEDYESIEKEKAWSNRGLVYRDEIAEDDYANARMSGFAAIYSQKKPIREKLMTAELQKLREENKRIQNEINEIHRRNNIDVEYRSEKLNTQDWRSSFYNSGPVSASKMLSEKKKKRESKSKKATAVIAKEDAIQKTIANARKNIRSRLDANHEESRGWSQTKAKKALDLSIQDSFTGLRPKSCRNKFSAGTPQTHLLESSILLARGIPTSYMSDRGFDFLYKTPTSRGSKSRRR